MNRWPRRLKTQFKHYYRALKQIRDGRDRELFRRWRQAISNIVYDAFIDTELARNYPKVREQIKEYLKDVKKPHILDEARELAVSGGEADWLDREHPENSFVHVFNWLKRNHQGLNQEQFLDYSVDADEDEEDVAKEASRFLGHRISPSSITEALIRSRFSFAVKAAFDFKVVTEASREVYDI